MCPQLASDEQLVDEVETQVTIHFVCVFFVITMVATISEACIHEYSLALTGITVEPLTKDPLRMRQSPSKGHNSEHRSHCVSSLLTSERRTASQQRDAPKVERSHCVVLKKYAT